MIQAFSDVSGLILLGTIIFAPAFLLAVNLSLIEIRSLLAAFLQ